MNVPNRLTVMRVVLVPVFMVFELIPAPDYHLLIALFLFIIASLTDLFDGKLARRNNQVTDFGKLMDPLADKLLVIAALVGFVQLGIGEAWVAVIIIARELLVTSLRMIAAGKGSVEAANIWGKVKTVSQMTAIIVVLLLSGVHPALANYAQISYLAGHICLWIASAFTVISGAQYVWAYRGYIDTDTI
jgi:CDP-diacylglycerol--glycerol-3-phosphate 3-phosphatidyltransferase